MLASMRWWTLAALLLAASPLASARAQAPQPAQSPTDAPDRVDEAAAQRLRAEGRAALAAGEIADAYARFSAAARRTADPTVWLEVAAAADRLRIDRRALEAYRRYLELRPDAPDRADVEGRVEALEVIVEGGRFVPGPGETVQVLRGWDEGAPPAPARRDELHPGGASVLVDWSGRPLERRGDVLALAEWDGTIRGGRRPARGAREPDGLGRRLGAP